MLLTQPSFIQRYAVRNYIHLFNPKINRKEDVVLPKQSLIHYIAEDDNVRFPVKDLYYFKDTPSTKKIKVQNITDLVVKEGNPILKDKLILANTRKWLRNNISIFRPTDIIDTPILDDTVVSLINYNMVKTAYRYNSSPLSRWFAYSNFQATCLTNLKEVINTHPSTVNFLPLYVPNVLYSYNVIKRISEFNPAKLIRLVHDNELLNVIELFIWLDKKTRDSSVYKGITDEDSSKVILAVEYKEHVVYLPMSLLIAMSEQSTLESKVKKPVDKVQRLFILFLLIVQNKVNKLLADDQTDTPDTDTKNLSSSVKLIPITPDVEVIETDTEVDIDTLEKEYTDIDVDASFTAVDLDSEDVEEELSFTATDLEIKELISEKNLDDKNTEYLSSLLDIKAVNSSDLRAVKKLIEIRKQLKSPYDQTSLLDTSKLILPQDKAITIEDKSIDIKNNLVAKDMQQNILATMDSKYIDNLLQKDILSCVSNIEKAGVVIKSYEVENKKSKLGNYEIHRLVIKPLLGKESTIYFKLPKVNSEGELLVSGVKVRLRKMKTDLPIRKISDRVVALSSNYGKFFISRSEKKAYDYYTYLTDHIKDAYIYTEEHSVNITGLNLGNTFDNKTQLPNIYSSMSMVFRSVSISTGYTFIFNKDDTSKYIKDDLIAKLKSSNYTFCGFTKDNTPIVVDMSDTFYIYGQEITSIGKMQDILQIPPEKIPTTFSNIKVLGKDLPLGVACAYYLGFNNLVKITKAEPIILEAGKHYKLSSDEYQIKFADYKLIFSKSNKAATLLLSGFLYFKDFTKEYTLQEFNKKNIYLVMIEERDFNIMYLKELDNLRDLFLDPITIDVLEDMQEPSEYLPLILRANEMLTSFNHPAINDSNYTRTRGYDRIPGLMYRALTQSLRDYKFKTNRSNKIEMSPYAVWNNIVSDNSKKLTEDINPINSLKETESVTLVGLDGLNKEAISSKLREYTPSDMGITSESTVDSSDVAINTFLTPYARFKNLRGMSDITDTEYERSPAKLLSTSALLVPGVDHDDPKRVFRLVSRHFCSI